MNPSKLIIASLAACLGMTASESAEPLRAGAATSDITPALGVSFNGIIMRIPPAKKIHDKLHARCLVLGDGRERIAIVIADVTVMADQVADEAKAAITERTGMPADRVLLAATHTHAAPRMMGSPRTELDREYYATFYQRVAEAVEQATKNLAPAEIGWGTARVPQFTQNRRWFAEPGAMPPNPLGGTADQVLMYGNRKGIGVKPSGPVDPELSVLSVRHADGRPLAVLANHSVHYVGGYGRATVSSDYFGYFGDEIAAQLDAGKIAPPFVGLMSNGTSGDAAAVGGGYRKMQLMARTLAAEAVRICEQTTYHARVPIVVRTAELELGVRRPNAERLAWAEKALSTPRPKGAHPWRRTYAREAIALSKYPPTVQVRLQAVRIGDLGIAAIPCEVFAETGLAIKAGSPFETTFAIELANGYHGYLPTPGAHKLGGYETWPARSSCLEVEAEPKISAAVLDLLREIRQTK